VSAPCARSGERVRPRSGRRSSHIFVPLATAEEEGDLSGLFMREISPKPLSLIP
jgi:hypothetical protein